MTLAAGLLICVSAAAAAAIVLREIANTRASHNQIRENMALIASRIEIGSPEKVIEDLAQGRRVETNGLRFVRFNDDAEFAYWGIFTPLEFGAKNWALYVALAGERAVGIGMRTEDSVNEMPSGAPPDRVAPSVRDQWATKFGQR
ncbi:MAG TPA: hypothetical protein VHY91_25110 [Pirellulales bacterium]|nr:hypothetical protein [Pirellulales bacterium]